MRDFIQEAYELLNEDLCTKIINGYKVINNLIGDILDSCDNPLTTINKSTKCSKSVVPLAIDSISKGKETTLCIGTFGLNNNSNVCVHTWVVSDGEILQTHVPKSINSEELTPYIKIKLIPNNINKSIELIKQALK